jgi:hypothetical protein
LVNWSLVSAFGSEGFSFECHFGPIGDVLIELLVIAEMVGDDAVKLCDGILIVVSGSIWLPLSFDLIKAYLFILLISIIKALKKQLYLIFVLYPHCFKQCE